MTETTFKPGDVVQMRSGSAIMTVAASQAGGSHVRCVFWQYEEGDMAEVLVPTVSLEHFPKKQRADWQGVFLAELSETGLVGLAAKAAGIGRKSVYQVRNLEPDFASAWDAAVAEAIRKLEDKAVEATKDPNAKDLRAFIENGRKARRIKSEDAGHFPYAAEDLERANERRVEVTPQEIADALNKAKQAMRDEILPSRHREALKQIRKVVEDVLLNN